MPGTVSPSVPLVGQNNSTEEPKIPSAIVTLRDALNAILTSGNAVDGSLIGAGTIPNSALATISLGKLVPGTDAQIPISNGSSFIARSLSGDVTVDNTGVVQIGNAKVGTVELADSNVTTPKLDDGAVTSAKANLSTNSVALTGGAVNLAASAGSWVSLATTSSLAAGNYYVVGCATITGNTTTGRQSLYTFRFNGADVNGSDIGLGTSSQDSGTVTIAQSVTLSSASTIALRGQTQSGGGTLSIDGTHGTTHLSYLRVG